MKYLAHVTTSQISLNMWNNKKKDAAQAGSCHTFPCDPAWMKQAELTWQPTTAQPLPPQVHHFSAELIQLN